MEGAGTPEAGRGRYLISLCNGLPLFSARFYRAMMSPFIGRNVMD
jgi:hypothetical protein